jgi:hypothetical protein
MRVEFGVFDHLDRNDAALRDNYEQRLQITEAFDAATSAWPPLSEVERTMRREALRG